jgi:hypothetical protein
MGEAAGDRIDDSLPAVSAHRWRAGRQLRNSRTMIAVCSLPSMFIGSIMPVDEAIPGGREVALTIYGATPFTGCGDEKDQDSCLCHGGR